MKVHFLDKVIDCEKAVKGSDFVHLLDSNGGVIASCEGVSDFSLFSIEGGEWSQPEYTDSERQWQAITDLEITIFELLNGGAK